MLNNLPTGYQDPGQDGPDISTIPYSDLEELRVDLEELSDDISSNHYLAFDKLDEIKSRFNLYLEQ